MAQAALPLMVASQLIGAIGEHDQLRAGAATDEENARRAELEGALEGEAIGRRERATSGEAIVALAGNGAAVGSGSALDLLQQNAQEREYEILARRYGAATEAQGLRQSAAGKRQAAKFALIGGVMRAGAQAVTGMGQMGDAAALRNAQLPGGMTLPRPAALAPMDDNARRYLPRSAGGLHPTGYFGDF